MHAEELRKNTLAAWRAEHAAPSDAVLDKMRAAAQRGFAWCIVEADALSPANLRWLSLHGYFLQKLTPREGTQPGWRITWMKLPSGLDSDL